MSNLNWTLFTGNSPTLWVLDITTESGDTQMYLSTSFPSDGTALTQAMADGIASGLQSAAEALSGVTSCAITLVSISNTSYANGMFMMVSLDSSEWICYEGIALSSGEFNTSTVLFIARYPADGILSGADISGLASGLESALSALSGVTSCTVSQNVISPSTV
jgi:hypothetical protein